MEPPDRFLGITTLRDALQKNNNQLQLIHPHKIWMASFTWLDPVPIESVQKVEDELGKQLPEDYKFFLTSISNGAMLYYDIQYGQWGYKIYGIDDIVEAQIKWSSMFEEDWTPNLLAAGKIIGESHALIMNLNKPTKDNYGCEVFDGNPLDPPEDWEKMSISFHLWLENIITAQGAKYWLWK
jgi:hypothetical protein